MDTWFNAVQAVEVARSELDWSVLTRSKEVKTVVHAKPIVLFMIKTPGNVFHDKWYSEQSRFIYTTPRISLADFKFNFFQVLQPQLYRTWHLPEDCREKSGRFPMQL